MMTGGGWSFHSDEHFHGAGLLVCWFLRGMVSRYSRPEWSRLRDSVPLSFDSPALTCGAIEYRRFATSGAAYASLHDAITSA